jgi:hypothetical protein
MLAGIPTVCCVSYSQLKDSQYSEQVERAPFGLTHDAFPLQDRDDGG